MTEENRPALLIARARSRRGISRYRVSARLDEAPEVFNCYRFMQWVWLASGYTCQIIRSDGQELMTCPHMPCNLPIWCLRHF